MIDSEYVQVVVPEEAPEAVDLVDRIERISYRLRTDGDPDPRQVDRADLFSAPVSLTAAIDADRIRMADLATVYVRTPEGTLLTQVSPAESATIEGPVEMELTGPMKIYLAVDGGVEISSDDRTVIAFDPGSEVVLGLRAFHESPAGTITTTAEPTDVMEGVSAFGSALKTRSPEVSFPTLRGHPPRLETGSELDIPAPLGASHSDVEIRVPPSLSWVYRVAPLSYYTAGRIVRGDDPVVAVNGRTIPLTTPDGAGETAETLLKRTLFWDTIVRTVGLYEIETWERKHALEAVDDDVDLERLYGLSMADRIDAYLDLPALEEFHPKWGRVAHLYGDPDELSLLPYLVNSLTLIREPTPVDTEPTEEFAAEFFRARPRDARSRGEQSGARGYRIETDARVIANYTTDEDHVGANLLSEPAFRQATRDEVHNQPLSTHVVCNEPDMDEEIDDVSRIYRERTGISSPVQIHEETTVDELAALLTSEAEYLHYVGHVTDEGIPCSDGVLDVRDLEEVGTRAFFLNACASIRQGRVLVGNGSIGGIVTTSDVPNEEATKLGARVARLLNAGFSLESAVAVISETSIVGTQYRVLGAGEHALTYAEAGTPFVVEIDGYDSNTDTVTFSTDLYSGSKGGLGSLFVPHIQHADQTVCYALRTYRTTRSDFQSFLLNQDNPILCDQGLEWSTDIEIESLFQ